MCLFYELFHLNILICHYTNECLPFKGITFHKPSIPMGVEEGMRIFVTPGPRYKGYVVDLYQPDNHRVQVQHVLSIQVRVTHQSLLKF